MTLKLSHHARPFAILLAGILTFGLCLPQSAFGQEGKKAESEKQEEKKQEDKKEDKKQEQEDGQEDLDKALELSQKAKTTRDLDKVADLLDSALEKKLDDESRQLATSLLKSTLANHVKKYTDQIFKIPRDTRWRFFRREALKRITRLQELDPKNADHFINEARLNGLPGGDREAAEKAIGKAAEMAGDDKSKKAEILLLRAALAKDDGKRLEDLSEALKLDPKNIRALTLRALYYEQKKEMDKAIADLETIAELQPNNLGILDKLIQTYAVTKKYDKAIAIADKLIDKQEDNPQLYLVKARLLAEKGDNEEAAKVLEEALDIDDSNTDILITQASVYFSLNKYQESLDAAETALEIQPGLIAGILWRSLANSGLENYDEAIEDMETLVDNSAGPQKQEFKMQLAMLFNAAEKHDDAIDIYDEFIDANAKNDRALRGRGDAYLGSGRHKKAIKDYDSALNVNADNSGVLNNLAWLLSTTPDDELRDGKRAVELSLKACKLTEYKQAHILSTLASSYAEADDFENALKWGKKAVEVGIEEKSTQLDDLKREVEAYKKKKKWREYKDKSGPEGEVEFDLDD